MKWLIYKHTNKINGKVYIGQTRYSWDKINDRWQNGLGYGIRTRLGMAIKKYGWNNFNHDLVEDNIPTQELANEREIYWINYYNSYITGYNCTLGGKSIPTSLCYKVVIYCYQTNKEYASIMDAAQELDFNYNKIQRQLYTGHRLESDVYFFCRASDKQKELPPIYKPQYTTHGTRTVICVETKEIWDSIVDCSISTGILAQNLSQNCCRNHKTAKGKHYAYLDEYNEDWVPAKEYNTQRRHKASSHKKEVYCLQTNKFYDSASTCAKELGLDVRQVTRGATGELINVHNFNFCYKENWYPGWQPRNKKPTNYDITDETRIKMRKSSYKKRVVICIETGIVYDSTKEAERQTGISADIISRVCNNKPHCKTAGGYHWKYIEE